MKISDIKSPELFQRLVRKLYIAEIGSDYQVVDDSGGDNGLDGYDRNKHDLYAIYCPEKPESANYKTKFKADLGKAIILRNEKGYTIEQFIFITPLPMREPYQRDLRDLSISSGLRDGINLGGEHLEVLLRKHYYIIDDFPELNYSRVEEVLKKFLVQVENKYSEADNCSNQINTPTLWLFENQNDPTIQTISSRLLSNDKSAINDLIFYRSNTNNVNKQLLVMSILIDYYFTTGNFVASEAVSREAVIISISYSSKAHEAYFRAMTAVSLCSRASKIDMNSVYKYKISNVLGLDINKQNRDDEVREMHSLRTQANNEIDLSLKLVAESLNFEALYHVLLQLAWKEAILARPHNLIKNYEEIDRALVIIRNVFERLFSICRYMGKSYITITFFEYSKILCSIGKNKEALTHAKKAESLAKSENQHELLEYKITSFVQHIESQIKS